MTADRNAAIAIAFSRYGPPEVLEAVDIADGHPGAGQVRVRVRAAGVQPFDCAIRRGALAQWMPVNFPSRLGNEMAGVIDEVGDGVASWSVGDEVLGFEQMACYAETLIVGADHLVAKPPAMPWEEAGVLPASGQTAHSVLDQLGVGPGDTLLVHAAAGGVGSFAVQIARARGATVVGTARESNHEYLARLGAIPVSYGSGLEDRVQAVAPGGVTAVLDCVGGDALEVSVHLVADRSRVGTIADPAGAARLGLRSVGTERSAARLSELIRLYETRALAVSIWKSVPLHDAAEAHREVETGHVRGKVVLTVGD